MILSIIIVNWNTRVYLERCLRSIEALPFSESCEVIVVDNNSHDGSANMVLATFPWATLLAQPTNLGYAQGNNAGFALAKGEFVLTLNPDTEVQERTLDLAVERLREAPGYAVLGARQIGNEGETQASVRGFPSHLGILGQILGLARWLPNSLLGSYQLPAFNYDLAQDAPQPMGTFLLFRRSALAEVGNAMQPMDPGFPIFFNEVDLLYRLNQTGWLCWYDPEVQIHHVGGAGTKQVRKSMIWESHRSLLRYFRKHQVGGIIGTIIHPLFALCVLAAALIRAKGFDRGFRP